MIGRGEIERRDWWEREWERGIGGRGRRGRENWWRGRRGIGEGGGGLVKRENNDFLAYPVYKQCY